MKKILKFLFFILICFLSNFVLFSALLLLFGLINMQILGTTVSMICWVYILVFVLVPLYKKIWSKLFPIPQKSIQEEMGLADRKYIKF